MFETWRNGGYKLTWYCDDGRTHVITVCHIIVLRSHVRTSRVLFHGLRGALVPVETTTSSARGRWLLLPAPQALICCSKDTGWQCLLHTICRKHICFILKVIETQIEIKITIFVLENTVNYFDIVIIRLINLLWYAKEEKYQIEIIIQEFQNLFTYYYYITWPKAVVNRCEDVAKYKNTRDHSAWNIGNWDPMHEVCIPHSIPCAWEQQEWNKRKKQTEES